MIVSALYVDLERLVDENLHVAVPKQKALSVSPARRHRIRRACSFWASSILASRLLSSVVLLILQIRNAQLYSVQISYGLLRTILIWCSERLLSWRL